MRFDPNSGGTFLMGLVAFDNLRKVSPDESQRPTHLKRQMVQVYCHTWGLIAVYAENADKFTIVRQKQISINLLPTCSPFDSSETLAIRHQVTP